MDRVAGATPARGRGGARRDACPAPVCPPTGFPGPLGPTRGRCSLALGGYAWCSDSQREERRTSPHAGISKAESWSCCAALECLCLILALPRRPVAALPQR